MFGFEEKKHNPLTLLLIVEGYYLNLIFSSKSSEMFMGWGARNQALLSVLVGTTSLDKA